MSDRCYMQLTCRQQDRKRFEALGFHPEFTDTPTDGPVVELIDTGADYGHANRLPTDVPFLANHDAGGNFGARPIACDGRRAAEVPTTSEGFVVEWDATKNATTARASPLSGTLCCVKQPASVIPWAGPVFGGLARTSVPPAQRWGA